MPKLTGSRQVVELDMDSIEGGKIYIYKKLLAGDLEEILQDTDGGSKYSIIAPVTKLIKDWNLEDETGNKLTINAENVRKLDSNDLTKIIQAAGLFSNESLLNKKK